MKPVLAMIVVGLTPRHLGPLTPRLSSLARDGAMVPLENPEHLMHRGFLVRRRRERLTDFKERRQTPQLTRAAAGRRFHCFQRGIR